MTGPHLSPLERLGATLKPQATSEAAPCSGNVSVGVRRSVGEIHDKRVIPENLRPHEPTGAFPSCSLVSVWLADPRFETQQMSQAHGSICEDAGSFPSKRASPERPLQRAEHCHTFRSLHCFGGV